MKKLFLFVMIAGALSCGSDGTDSRPSEWLIPVEQVFDGGVGIDGIPAVDNPNFSTVGETSFVPDDALVVGVFHNGQAKAYPHQILDWHEIVNDEIDDLKYGLTYCPLTGTAINWNRVIDGNETTFGVSGKLFNTNLMPFDRETNSYWSQIRLDCVNGEHIGTEIEVLPVIETTWATWEQAYPDSEVQNTITGFSRNYQDYPYGDYRTNDSNIIFPVDPLDDRLPAKERVLTILSNSTNIVYSIELFDSSQVIIDTIAESEILVIGSKADNYVVSFDNIGLENVQAVADALPVIAEDGDGNRITMHGEIVAGPLSGKQLNLIPGFMSYFFAVGAFYEDIEIYNE